MEYRVSPTCLASVITVVIACAQFLSGIFLIDIVLFKNKKAIVAVEVRREGTN